AEAGLDQEAEVVRGRVVLPDRERRLGDGGPPGPVPPAVELVGEPQATGPEAGQPATGALGPPRAGPHPRSGTGPSPAGGRCERAGPGRRCGPAERPPPRAPRAPVPTPVRPAPAARSG